MWVWTSDIRIDGFPDIELGEVHKFGFDGTERHDVTTYRFEGSSLFLESTMGSEYFYNKVYVPNFAYKGSYVAGAMTFMFDDTYSTAIVTEVSPEHVTISWLECTRRSRAG